MKLKLAILMLMLLVWQQAMGRIAIYGDTRTNPDIHALIVAKLVEQQPQLTIHTGDLNSKGTTQKEYDDFLCAIKPLSSIAPYYAVKGNHEKSRDLFLQNFPNLGEQGYARIEHEGLLIYLLDSTADLVPGSAQYKWFSAALTDSLPGIVVMHHPVFSSGYHGGDQALQMFLPQLLKKGRILAVFSGHDHSYERSEFQGISYIVTGGGGSLQREERTPNPHSLIFTNSYHYIVLSPGEHSWTAEVWNLEDKLLDSFRLEMHEHE